MVGRAIRRAGALLASAAMLAAIGGCSLLSGSSNSSQLVPERGTLRIGVLPAVDVAPLYIAQRDKLFDASGLQVELISQASETDAIHQLEAGTIDMVLCIEVPPVTSAGWFVQETFRVLRPGGLLVGATENRSSYRAVVHRLFRRRRSDVGFYRTSYPDLRNRLRREGFALLHEEGCCWLPFGRSSDSAFIPALARLEGRMGLRRLAAVGPWVAYIVQKK